MATPKVVVATESFSADIGGEEVIVHHGDRFPATAAVVKAHGQWFEPVKP